MSVLGAACGIPLSVLQSLPLEHIYSAKIVSARTNPKYANVATFISCSVLDFILFRYATEAIRLGRELDTVNIADFPVLPAKSRAAALFARMRRVPNPSLGRWTPKPGSGYQLAYRLVRVNCY